MAKDQSLSLNPSKISGLCGRLMCCLKYESEVYEKLLEKIPPVGTIAITPEGTGTIVETYTLLEMAKVKVKLEDDTEDIFSYNLDDIQITDEIDPEYQKVIETESTKDTLEENEEDKD